MGLEQLLEYQFVRENPIFRKGLSFVQEPAARLERLMKDNRDYSGCPPIVVNSLPKSGTHLLLQITKALPNTRYLGRFVATTPSLTLRERSEEDLAKRINRVLPCETLGAHLHYSKSTAEAVGQINALHLFIYRDPRDVIASEAHYLAKMNRWHRMHSAFKVKTDIRSRFQLAIDGVDARYPEANKRLLPYAGWLTDPDVIAIRYEDLAGPCQRAEIGRIVEAWRDRRGKATGVDGLVSILHNAIDPHKSHTFREGGTGKWRRGLTDAESDQVSSSLYPSLAAFGYAE